MDWFWVPPRFLRVHIHIIFFFTFHFWYIFGICFYMSSFVYFSQNISQITLLRVIPTMTSIRFVTGKSSGILSDISSGISSGILPGISSGICSGISSGILSGISSGISSDILSGKSSGVLSGKHSGTLSGIPSGILSDILSGKSSGILSGKHSGTLSGIPSGIPSGISSGVLSGISSSILSGRWGPAVLTELGRSQVEVQRCSLSSAGPRLRSSGAHWARPEGLNPIAFRFCLRRCYACQDHCWGTSSATFSLMKLTKKNSRCQKSLDFDDSMHCVQNVCATIVQNAFMVPAQASNSCDEFQDLWLYLWDQVTETSGPGERHLHVRQLGEGSTCADMSHETKL